MRRAGQVPGVLLELVLAVSPGEVRVALAEADPGQLVHHRGAGERLGQEQHVRMLFLDRRDQPVPEVDRLGMGIVTRKILTPASIQTCRTRRHSP